jgi:hypothetical protein
MDIMAFLCSSLCLLVGNKVPVSEVNEAIVERYRADKLKEAEDSVEPYRRLCQQKQVA